MTPDEQLQMIRQQLADAWASLRGWLSDLWLSRPGGDFIDRMRARRESRLRRGTRILAAVLLVVLGVPAVAILLPYSGHDEPVTVVIEPGMGRRAISRRLADHGILIARWPFLLYAGVRPWSTLKAGEYRFDRALSAAGVVHKLVRGGVYLHPLTILEGWTRWEIADEVARTGLADRDEFLKAAEDWTLIEDLDPEATTLEGYLYPDTYRFPRPTPPEDIVRVMVDRFREVFAELDGVAPGHGLSVHEAVTLASLVEEETGSRDERRLIAGVYVNRLKRRMRLQCDPTVIYAARLAFNGRFDGVINQSDLERKSPYNTYQHAGLPPGPIASPGRGALAAALNPAETDYLFFVSNLEGGHYFAATGSEHARNVARYRRLRAGKQE